MAKVASAIISFGCAAIGGWPIVGQFHFRHTVLSGRCEENEREAANFAVETADFFQPNQFEKCDRCVRVRHADHRVEIFRRHVRSVHGAVCIRPQWVRADNGP